MAVDLEKCANCDRMIGRLEPTFLLNDHVVCTECNQKLRPPVIEYFSPAHPVEPSELDSAHRTVFVEKSKMLGKWIKLQRICIGLTLLVAIFFWASANNTGNGQQRNPAIVALAALLFCGAIAWAIALRGFEWWKE